MSTVKILGLHILKPNRFCLVHLIVDLVEYVVNSEEFLLLNVVHVVIAAVVGVTACKRAFIVHLNAVDN